MVLRDGNVCPVLQVPICPSAHFSTDWPSMTKNAGGPLLDARDVDWLWSQYIADESTRR
jgi:hypothetical protein